MLSKYQEAICSHLKNRSGHSAVISVAGSGKTFTAIKAAASTSPAFSLLMGAFNVSIRDEFKSRLINEGVKHAIAVNYNGFGWGICLRNLRHKPEIDKEKTSNVLEFKVMCPHTDEEYKRFTRYKSPITRLVSIFKSLNIHDYQEVHTRYNEIVDYFNLDTPEDEGFQQLFEDTFKACIEHQAHYDFDDQKYMPIHLGMQIPGYDQVIIDEFQDTSPLEMALMGGAVSRDGQFCAVGDPDQAIYGFKAATPQAFDDYIRDWRATTLPLSICYRCPKVVIAEAKKIVSRIEAAPGAIEGSFGYCKTEDFRKNVRDKDFVLCRTTEPLVKECIRLIGEGRKAKVRGRDFGTYLTMVIDRVAKNNDNLETGEFITALCDYQITRTGQLEALRRDNEITNLEDRVATIKALSNNASRVSDIKKALSNVFSDAAHGGIDLMTCHKSKGLQSKNVYCLRPDLLPHPNSQKRSWMAAEERRLKYVTLTRAEENFTWVEEE